MSESDPRSFVPRGEYYCETCGKTDVQWVDWVDPNSGKAAGGEGFISDMCYAVERGMTWCLDCEDHTPISWREGRTPRA